MDEIDDFPHAPVLQLLTGHYHETSGYRAYRPGGVGDWLLIHTISGAGRFGYAGGDLIAGLGDWVLIRPGTLHDYAVAPQSESWELAWAHFQPRPAWLQWLDWPEVAPGLMLLQPAERLPQRLLEVHQLLTSDLQRREAYAMNALELLFLDCDRLNPREINTRHDDRVLRAVDFLERNLALKVTLNDVAIAAGLSESRLAHLFRSETGQTVQGHLEARRMQLAAELLSRTGFSVKQIAGTVGYDSPFYFSQRFKRWTGQSPAAFRNEAQARG
ncbi:MAG: helix-turn-helix domain-containing protein [Devosia sp.]